jgi:hypothetical protein
MLPLFPNPHFTNPDMRSEHEIAVLLARHEQDMANALEREERYSNGPMQTPRRPVTPLSSTWKAKPLRRYYAGYLAWKRTQITATCFPSLASGPEHRLPSRCQPSPQSSNSCELLALHKNEGGQAALEFTEGTF